MQTTARRMLLQVGALIALGAGLSACGSDNNGAPKIPHSITAQTDSSCLACHQSGTHATSHPSRANCTSCHTQ